MSEALSLNNKRLSKIRKLNKFSSSSKSKSSKSKDGREILKDLNSSDYDLDIKPQATKARKIGNSSKSNKFSKTKQRVKSIDVIRGLAIALMIVGNNPGTWQRVYPQLRHAKWHGVTLADFGFPFFVIALGVTIPISIDSRIKRKESILKISISIIRRSVMLFFIGLILNFLKDQDLSTIRILGVLQRMGIVYFVTSFSYLFMKKAKKRDLFIITSMIAIATFIIVGYYFIAKPYGFQLEGSLAQRVDMFLFKGHLYDPNFEPDGFLTSIVAISSGMLGCSMGCIISNKRLGEYKKFFILLVFGLVLLILSKYFNDYFPYNKRLWSSSFVLLMAGSYGILLSILYLICDIIKINKIFIPIIALGSSPILIYVLLESVQTLFWNRMVTSNIPPYGQIIFVENFTYNYITPWAGTTWDSLVFSIGYLIIWTIIMLFIFKKNIVIKL
jgi:predicted acyltransferase